MVKKITLIALLVALVAMVNAQNIQLHYDFGADRHYLTTTVERFTPDAHGSTFFFIDMDYSENGVQQAYWEIANICSR